MNEKEARMWIAFYLKIKIPTNSTSFLSFSRNESKMENLFSVHFICLKGFFDSGGVMEKFGCCRIVPIPFTHTPICHMVQCDQIGLFLKDLGYWFSWWKSPNILQLFGVIVNASTFLVKLLWLIFGQLLEKIGFHFTPISGHTAHALVR